jgi:hypothetical protein
MWCFNNNLFTAAFKEVLKSTKDIDIGYERLNYAIKFIAKNDTRETCFGADVQNLRQDKYL